MAVLIVIGVLWLLLWGLSIWRGHNPKWFPSITAVVALCAVLVIAIMAIFAFLAFISWVVIAPFLLITGGILAILAKLSRRRQSGGSQTGQQTSYELDAHRED